MALANYSDLLTAVGNWLNRADLTARIPEFITLAEAEFNRKLRTVEMESATTLTLTGDTAAVPAGYLGVRSLKIDNTLLDYVPPSEIYDDETTGGYPTRYTVVDGSFVFRPAPSSGSADLVYYSAIPGLTASNTTNWLMTRWPDLYLFGVCAQAEFYVWDDARVPLWKARTEEIIDQINLQTASERHGGRRLAARHGVAVLRQIPA